MCNPNPCQNGGTCASEDKNRFTCKCPKQCKGANCEKCELGMKLDKFINYIFCSCMKNFYIQNKTAHMIKFSIIAYFRDNTGFPAFWLLDADSNVQYNGPKDVNSMTYFINEKLGKGIKKKVCETYQIRLQYKPSYPIVFSRPIVNLLSIFLEC